MEIHERIKKVRKDNVLTQDEFAVRLGVTRSVISNIELNRLAKPEQKTSLIKLIAREFNLNEKWLLDGEHPMNVQPETFSLDEYVKKRVASELELEILRAYFSMEPEVRQSVISHFKAHLGQTRTETDGHDELAATLAVRPAVEDRKVSREQAHAMIDAQFDDVEKGQTSQASTTSSGLGEKLA